MFNKKSLTTALALLLTSASFPLFSAEKGQKGSKDITKDVAVVNFTLCVLESKYGKREQESFEAIKGQMQKAMSDLDRQLTDMMKKLEDPNYTDSLSPEAEHELRSRCQALGDELSRYQNQYYQVLQQANMRFMQSMNDYVSQAATRVAGKENLNFILNKEALFYFTSSYDVTPRIIAELDALFDEEAKKAPAPAVEEAKP